jgi:hypothetical protein
VGKKVDSTWANMVALWVPWRPTVLVCFEQLMCRWWGVPNGLELVESRRHLHATGRWLDSHEISLVLVRASAIMSALVSLSRCEELLGRRRSWGLTIAAEHQLNH